MAPQELLVTVSDKTKKTKKKQQKQRTGEEKRKESVKKH
jgi:hypothetical protein